MSMRTHNGTPIISGEMIAEAHKRARKERALAFRRIAVAVFAPVTRAVRAATAASEKVELSNPASGTGIGKTTSGRGFI